jgi:hypothetical protein
VVVALAAEPPRPVPDWALRSGAVYRAQVGLALLVALYVPISLVGLALRGRLLTRFAIGPAVAEGVEHVAREGVADLAELEDVVGELRDELRDLRRHVRRIEREVWG